jgi:hypothetical protein
MRKPRTLRNLTFALTALGLVIGFAHEAEARVGEKKAGPLMGNFKLAPAVSFGDIGYIDTQFAMELEIAYAVDKKNNAYIGFNPQFQFARFTNINLTGTFQYDIELPVEGLYLYPKINAGLAIFPASSYGYYCGRFGCGGSTGVAFALQPEFGVKYNIMKNFHVLGEPLSFPIYIAGHTFAQWRFWFGVGFDV